MTAAIKIQGLTKDYGGGRGLFDLDLEVMEGEAFGYLGPNGAGKSTTIRLLMGLIHATRGSATILGLDAMREAVEVKRLVGYIPGELPQFGGLRAQPLVLRREQRPGVAAGAVQEEQLEHQLRIAHVFAQRRRHGRCILEQSGKNLAVRHDDWILQVKHIERRGAIVCIDDDLNAIPHVVNGSVA